jgi:hypothetical protein
VEIAANGTYLISQFLNPRLNRRSDRSDRYGACRHRLRLEIVDAVTAAWDGRRVGVRLSPYWATADRARAEQGHSGYPYTTDEQTLADYDALVAGLSERPLAYLHLRGRAPAVPGVAPGFDAITRYRKLFDGPLIANHGFGRETGNAIVEAGSPTLSPSPGSSSPTPISSTGSRSAASWPPVTGAPTTAAARAATPTTRCGCPPATRADRGPRLRGLSPLAVIITAICCLPPATPE